MLPFFMQALSIDGFHPRPTLRHPNFPVTSTAVLSSPNLCALCVGVYPERLGAFSSPDVDALDAASNISPVSATPLPRAAAKGTKNTEGWVSLPIVNPIFQSNHRFISNSHRITSFAYPYLLTPIESYSCKKQGVGVGSRSRAASFRVTSRHAGTLATPIPSRVYFIISVHPGWGVPSAILLCATSAHGVHPDRVGASASTPSRSGRYPLLGFRLPPLCHPERSRVICFCYSLSHHIVILLLRSPTDHGSLATPFVPHSQ